MCGGALWFVLPSVGHRRCDVLCSWGFPSTIQLSGLFWERRDFPSVSTVILGAGRGVGEEGSPWRGVLGQALALLCSPRSCSPSPSQFLSPNPSLIAALESPCIQPLLLGNTQHQGSSAGAGGRGIPWGSGKAQWGFVGHKTPYKPPRAPAAMFRAVTNIKTRLSASI